MAGTIIVSSIKTDTDNSFIVRSNTGATLFSVDTTSISIPDGSITSAMIANGTVIAADILDGTITDAKIAAVANTKITGLITSGQIATVANTQITGNITQAQIATGVAGTGPAFSANAATTQSISNQTYTKVTLGTEVFDTNSNFASSRFTPTVAGYYQINAGIFYNTSATTGLGQILIYKNGSEVNGTVSNMSASGYCGLSIATLTYCNGTTDYIELYTYHAFGTAQNVSSGTTVFMTGAMVRSA
jgi:hypothetical protein